jgi:ATP-dependent protease ClpP protease subunit
LNTTLSSDFRKTRYNKPKPTPQEASVTISNPHIVYKNNFDTILCNFIYPGNTLMCTISGKVSNDLYKTILTMEEDLKQSPYSGICDNLAIVFSSYGGVISSGFSIIDYINTMKTIMGFKVIFIATGTVASMGLPIILSGDATLSYDTTKFMYHQLTCGVNGDLFTIKTEADRLTDTQKTIDEYIISRTKLTQESLDKFKMGNTWLNSKQAKKYGIIQKII